MYRKTKEEMMSQEKSPLEKLPEEMSASKDSSLSPKDSTQPGEAACSGTEATATAPDTHDAVTTEPVGGAEAPAIASTTDAAPEVAIAAEASSSSAENTGPEHVEPMKGVGFLGRRGTAPIHTVSVADATDTGDAGDVGAEPGGKQDATSPPAAPRAKPVPTAPLVPGMAENSFSLMSYAGLLFLALLLLMQTAAGVYFPSIFLPQEAALVEVYELMAQGGQWLAPPATAALPAALPGYFWFLSGVDMLPGLGDPFFLPVSAALSALVALLGTYTLGLCAGLGKRVSFAAGLMLLSMLGFVPLTHWVGPDVLQAGILAFSLACLYRGWANERAFLWLALGFVLAGAATLVGGFMALWIPLVASILFIFWRGTLRRGHRLDAVLGFALLLICIAGWLGAVILLTGDSAAVLAPLFDQLAAPLLPPYWPPKDPWWLGLALLGAGLLPWVFIPLFVSWNRVAANAWPGLKAARKEQAGVAWLWICLLCGLALLLACSSKPLLMAVPLLPLTVLLLAKALLHLSHAGSRLFFLLLALLCLVAGAALSAAGIPVVLNLLKPHLPATVIDLAAQSAGLPLLGGVLLLAALVLVRFTNRAFPGGSLAVFVLLVTMLVQPATLLTGPSHAGKLAVYLPKGMGMHVLANGEAVSAPVSAKPEISDTPAAPSMPAIPAPTEQTPAPEAPAQQSAPTTTSTPESATPVQPSEAAPEPESAPRPEPDAPAQKPQQDAGEQDAPEQSAPGQLEAPVPAPAVPAAAPISAPEASPAPTPNVTAGEKQAPAPAPAAPAQEVAPAPPAQEKPAP